MQLDDLALRIAGLSPAPHRRIVAIAGPPASGKSTLAKALAQRLTDGGTPAAAIPMDGFHLDDRLLHEDGTQARKGAPHTFDAFGFLALVAALQAPRDVIFPLFDRTREIAIAGAGRVPASCETVIVEGNYLLLDSTPWDQLRPHWGLSLALHPPRDVLLRRLEARWHALGKDASEARAWIAQNDIPNIDAVLNASAAADITLTEPLS